MACERRARIARRLSARRSSSLRPPQNAVVLIGVERAFQTRVNHLAGTANGLGFFDLLIGGTGVADREKQFRILIPARAGSPIESTAHVIAFLLP